MFPVDFPNCTKDKLLPLDGNHHTECGCVVLVQSWISCRNIPILLTISKIGTCGSRKPPDGLSTNQLSKMLTDQPLIALAGSLAVLCTLLILRIGPDSHKGGTGGAEADASYG